MTEEISLYRKYRPYNFENLVGQDHVRTTLQNALRKKQTAHAYLFCGPRGTGKTSTARLIAKGLMCQNLSKNAEPCNECEMCRDISLGRLIDLIEIDAASNRGIDDVRDLREKIQFAPTRAAKKVYIIDEVHMLTKEAFNALLKTLEEPPLHAHFVLATTEVHKVPETIISRCQRFDFRRITVSDIVSRLKFIAESEHISAEESALQLIAEGAEGGLRDAIGLLEQMVCDGSVKHDLVTSYLGLTGETVVEEFLNHLVRKSVSQALEKLNSLYQSGLDVSQFNKEILSHLRSRLLQAVSRNDMNDVDVILKLISHFQEAQESLKSAVIPQLPLELAIVESCLCPREHRSLHSSEAQALYEFHHASTAKPEQRNESGFQPTASAASEKKFAAASSGTSVSEKSASRSSGVPASTACDFDSLTKYWARVIDHVTVPAVQRSAQQARIESFEEDRLVLSFSSRFHLDNVNETRNIRFLEDAIFTIFQKKVRIECALREISLDEAPPLSLDSSFSGKEQSAVSKHTRPETDLAESVAEMFDSEIIEESS